MENSGIKQFNKFKGDAGEEIACVWLEQNGFVIIETKYKNKHGEIDIVATKTDRKGEVVYHFIEVKMRTGSAHGSGREAVNVPKQKRIRGTAQYYLIEHGLHNSVYSCFDVIEIDGWFDDFKIEFLENCF